MQDVRRKAAATDIIELQSGSKMHGRVPTRPLQGALPYAKPIPSKSSGGLFGWWTGSSKTEEEGTKVAAAVQEEEVTNAVDAESEEDFRYADFPRTIAGLDWMAFSELASIVHCRQKWLDSGCTDQEAIRANEEHLCQLEMLRILNAGHLRVAVDMLTLNSNPGSLARRVATTLDAEIRSHDWEDQISLRVLYLSSLNADQATSLNPTAARGAAEHT